jgi:histone deacetylase 6
VNIPAMIPDPSFSSSSTYLGHSPPSQTEIRTQELLAYLWDNYLEGYASSSIVLMGVGDAYVGIKKLLEVRNCMSKVACVLSFVSGGTLKAVKSETEPQLSNWYKRNSRIYVAPDHACWLDEDSAKRVRKARFGAVTQSIVSGLGDMLKYYLVRFTSRGCNWNRYD